MTKEMEEIKNRLDNIEVVLATFVEMLLEKGQNHSYFDRIVETLLSIDTTREMVREYYRLDQGD